MNDGQMFYKALYGKSSTGKLLYWSVSVTKGSSEYVVQYGQLAGKIQSKTTKCKPKNVGRGNETTAEEQALVEAEAKFVLQQKKGYYLTQEEALAHVEYKPMTLQAFKGHKGKITYPAYIQRKLDGQRFLYSKDKQGYSKSGEPLEFPEHIQKEINILIELLGYSKSGYQGFDGEIYAGLERHGGLSLQRIISAFRKPNEDTPKLQYHIYDIPVEGINFFTRSLLLDGVSRIVEDNGLEHIVVEQAYFVEDEDELLNIFEYHVEQGFEGSVVRNHQGMYIFGKRSYDAQKLKPRQTTEALVLSTESDKNNQGLLSCQLKDGTMFKCLMLKEADPKINLRLYENSKGLVGKHIMIEYESLSDSGVPTKPVGVLVRRVNPKTWEALD